METQFGRKPSLLSSLSSIFIIWKNIYNFCTDVDSYQYSGIYLQKATTLSHFLAATGRALQPPNLVYQSLLEGSFNPLIRTPYSTRRMLLLSYMTTHIWRKCLYTNILESICITSSPIRKGEMEDGKLITFLIWNKK